MKVHIKRLLPPESMFRNIIVCTSDGRKFKLGHLQEMELEVEDGGWVSFRLDLYHRKIHLDPSGQGSEVCIILRYAMRQGFLGIIDSFGNMLRADIVDKSVYEDGGKWLLSQTPAIKKYAVLDYVLVSLLALPFLAFLLYPVLHPGMAGRDFVFFISFLCTFGCVRLLVVRNRIPVQDFNLTVCLSLAIQLLLLFYAALPLVWTLFIALVMLAAWAVFLFQRMRETSGSFCV